MSTQYSMLEVVLLNYSVLGVVFQLGVGEDYGLSGVFKNELFSDTLGCLVL